jgi:hypothetical protein
MGGRIRTRLRPFFCAPEIGLGGGERARALGRTNDRADQEKPGPFGPGF